jgi:hypothetical protein
VVFVVSPARRDFLKRYSNHLRPLPPDTVYPNTPQVRAAKASVDTVAVRTAAVTAGAPASAPAVHPLSASGCNDSVCIEVVGDGLTVDDWNTFVYVDPGSCSFAAYWEDDEIAFTGEEVCAEDDSTLLETYASDFDGEFDNGEQLCNTWVNRAGKPCETIEIIEPFHIEELPARIRVAVRRCSVGDAVHPQSSLDEQALEIKLRNTYRPSRKEGALFCLLCKHPGEVIDRSHLAWRVWGKGISDVERTLESHMSSLRRKVPARYVIKNVRGIGYMLVEEHSK